MYTTHETMDMIEYGIQVTKEVINAEINVQWNPINWVIDQSNTELGAINKVFPEAEVVFCLVHVRRTLMTRLHFKHNMGIYKLMITAAFKMQ